MEKKFDGVFTEVPCEKIGKYTTPQIIDETMLFCSGWDFAYENSGPITREILDKLSLEFGRDSEMVSDNYPYPVVDTRVHMLMPGMVPAIPGWHCDNVPRGESGQPDLTKAARDQLNYTVLVGDSDFIAPTEFITNPLTLSYDPNQVWGSINQAVITLPHEEKNYASAIDG